MTGVDAIALAREFYAVLHLELRGTESRRRESQDDRMASTKRKFLLERLSEWEKELNGVGTSDIPVPGKGVGGP